MHANGYRINKTIHGCLEIPDLFLVLNLISHSFAALTLEISSSTLEINLVFPRVMLTLVMIMGNRDWGEYGKRGLQ